MDKFKRHSGSLEILRNEVFEELYQESYNALMKVLENGSPDNPEALVRANVGLRTLRDFKRKFETAAKPLDEE